MKTFINVYYENSEELKNIEVSYIKEYAICWINYILNGNNFDTSLTESFEVKKKLLNENL